MILRDHIFSRAGLMKTILRRLFLAYFSVLLIAYIASALTSAGWPLGFAVFAMIGLYITVGLPLQKYDLARKKHLELVSKYGDRYTRLVEDGTIPLTAHAVLNAGSPAMFERLLRKPS